MNTNNIFNQTNLIPSKKPIIYLLAVCWNESLFLPYFLNYYSFVDKIIIFDNFSSDNSVEIMKQFNNVEFTYYNTNEKIRDDIYLEIKNNVWKSYRTECDWMIIVDIDEIIYHPMGLDKYIQSLPNDIAILQCTGFEMISPNFLLANGQSIFEKCNRGVPLPQLNKCSVINTKLVKEINYLAGAHMCNPITSGKTLKDTIKLLHYKFIFPIDFLIQRYTLMSQRLSDENKKNAWGLHYNNISKMVKKYQNLITQCSQVI